MRKCTKCGAMSSKFRYSAWTVRSRGYVTFDSNGNVQDVSGSVAEAVVKAGSELKSPGARLTCHQCGHEDLVKRFPVVGVSWLSCEPVDPSKESAVPFRLRMESGYSQPFEWVGTVLVDSSETQLLQSVLGNGTVRIIDAGAPNV